MNSSEKVLAKDGLRFFAIISAGSELVLALMSEISKIWVLASGKFSFRCQCSTLAI